MDVETKELMAKFANALQSLVMQSELTNVLLEKLLKKI
jgi:hypothetical protein